MEEVSAGVYAMAAMEVLSVKIMSMFKCHRQRDTISAATVAVSLHSYHGMRDDICDDKYAKPKGFEVRHLNLDASDHAEMIRAYKADDSPFHKVDLKHVYAVATGDDTDMLPLTKGQITPWLGKQLFAIAPPGCTAPLLYTPASASMKRWGDPAVLSADEKLDRVMVPLVPKDARIKMTVLQNITADGDTEAMDDKQYGEALHRSLRHELMTICHATQLPHASKADTMKVLRTMAYWPSAERDVEKFSDTCDTCLANRDPMARLGSSMTSTRRFAVMMIDKIVFDDDVAEITGMPAALLMTCPRINDALIRMLTSMTAVEAARVIYCTGIP